MSKTILRKFLIAKGNSTLLVWNCLRANRPILIKKNLGKVEQIGFVTKQGDDYQLEMMGNELCINGTIALASILGRSGNLLASGIDKKIKYSNSENLTKICLPINPVKVGKDILLSGIGFTCMTKKPKNLKVFLKRCTQKYDLPAFGLIIYKKNKITPYVYVKGTNTLFKETACGSGSIALNVAKNYANIIQPTREKITIKRSRGYFEVSAKVTEIKI